jgi:hypothetical protein
MLRMMGTPSPLPRSDGISHYEALREGSPLQERLVYTTGVLYGPERHAIIDGARKWIKNTDDAEDSWTPVPGYAPDAPYELYDLSRDPEEKHNKLSGGQARSEVAAKYEAAMEAILAATETTEAESITIDEALKGQLESLGYIN